MKLTESVLVPIHRAGWPFIAVFAAVTAVLFAVWPPAGWAGAVATAWCIYFFRDPDRVTPAREGLIISPADGVVLPITQAPPPPELGMEDGPRTRISIFMNVFDVHVNRSPCDGAIVTRAYTPGKFFNASLDKASEHNERMSMRINPTFGPASGGESHASGGESHASGGESAGNAGGDLIVVQIAGLVARRIKTFVGDGQKVRAGERIGLIRFGSRVDVYLPDGVNPLVAPGQRAVAGETVLADVRAQEPSRPGEIR